MDRLTLTIVAGVLALIAGGLLIASARSQAPTPDLTTPHGVVLAYALAESRGDAEAAWELLDATAQSRTDRDKYLARVAGDGYSRAGALLSTERELITGDESSVVLVRTYSGSGTLFGSQAETARTTVRLTRSAVGWRIRVPPDSYNLIAAAGVSA